MKEEKTSNHKEMNLFSGFDRNEHEMVETAETIETTGMRLKALLCYLAPKKCHLKGQGLFSCSVCAKVTLAGGTEK